MPGTRLILWMTVSYRYNMVNDPQSRSCWFTAVAMRAASPPAMRKMQMNNDV